ncbi:MAG: hypothetical protein HY332_23390 [Chloroflexi bacterium]|nr:hypothetical protein [Chloroflexota bacterium]
MTGGKAIDTQETVAGRQPLASAAHTELRGEGAYKIEWVTCEHDDDTVPGLVLDPFAGTGTTLEVAARLGRRAVDIDLAPVTTEAGPWVLSAWYRDTQCEAEPHGAGYPVSPFTLPRVPVEPIVPASPMPPADHHPSNDSIIT